MEKGGAVTSGSSSQYALKTRAAGTAFICPAAARRKSPANAGLFLMYIQWQNPSKPGSAI